MQKLNDLQTANNFKRLIACIIDWYISSVIAGIPVIMLDARADEESRLMFSCIAAALAILICSLYYVVIPLRFNGQTIGKKIMGIKIININGSDVNLLSLVKREIIGVLLIEGSIVASSSYLRELLQLLVKSNVLVPLSIISSIVTIASIALAFFKKDKRMFHDYIGGTIVVNKV